MPFFQWILASYARLFGKGLFCNGFWEQPVAFIGAVAQLQLSSLMPSVEQLVFRFVRTAQLTWLMATSLSEVDPQSSPLFVRTASAATGSPVEGSVVNGFRYSTKLSADDATKTVVTNVREVQRIKATDDVAALVQLEGPGAVASVPLSAIPPLYFQFVEFEGVRAESAAALRALAKEGEVTVLDLLRLWQLRGSPDFLTVKLPPGFGKLSFRSAADVDAVASSSLAASTRYNALADGLRMVRCASAGRSVANLPKRYCKSLTVRARAPVWRAGWKLLQAAGQIAALRSGQRQERCGVCAV